MTNKVRVYGKAQNRTALGIMHAYMVMYPHATIDDLRKAFPDDLAPDNGTKKIFVPADEKGGNNWNGYFDADNELLTTGDGAMVAVNKMWTKPSFERLVSHASQYGVEIAQFEAADGAGKKGGFRLEYLNGYVPPVPEPKRKGMPVWLWIALGLLAAGIIALLLLPRDEKVVEVEKIVEKEVVVRDTVYVQQIEDIESAFNAAKFAVNSAELNDDAKLALHDLAKVMKQNPELRLRIEGHTSSEGDSLRNQQLSEQRAKAAVSFLVDKEGIDASRLSPVGMGSSVPVDPENPEANRRTQFEILN